ncbi:hypothetical protein ACM66B_004834 [Microbotryomycetes sp. NB124-2]
MRPTTRLLRRLRAARAPAAQQDAPAQDLVGPPCPLSNLRPVFYAPLFPTAQRTTAATPDRQPGKVHPYRVEEFRANPAAAQASAAKERRLQLVQQRFDAADLEWRLTRYRIDRFNQDFWSRTNALFLQQRDDFVRAALAAAPPSEPATAQVDLAPFYAQHLKHTKQAYAAYNKQLWRMQLSTMLPAAKAALRRWQWRWELWKATPRR